MREGGVDGGGGGGGLRTVFSGRTGEAIDIPFLIGWVNSAQQRTTSPGEEGRMVGLEFVLLFNTP